LPRWFSESSARLMSLPIFTVVESSCLRKSRVSLGFKRPARRPEQPSEVQLRLLSGGTACSRHSFEGLACSCGAQTPIHRDDQALLRSFGTFPVTKRLVQGQRVKLVDMAS
jgi:hypothetical protein